MVKSIANRYNEYMSQIDDIKAAIDIVDVIGQKIELKRVGSYWRGLSPWTNEKSPSFFVSPSYQRFKDYSSGKSGDVFTFLQEYDGLTFAEALQELADKAGIALEKYQASAQDLEISQIYQVLNLAKEYYHYLLNTHPAGQTGRDYAKARGITRQSIKVFQLGVATDSWDGLIRYLHGKKKFSLDLLDSAGLIVRKNHKSYDRFRNRLIFPLTNHRGQVVGFSGRVMDSTTKTAKYINSPETKLYHKSNHLYGFSELFQEINKKESVIVTEGELDVISSAQAHVNNIVAIKGSALTDGHVQLLKRAAKTILLCLDSDSAGIRATKRAIPIINQHQLELRVIELPADSDVDDLAKKTPDTWRQLAKSAVSVYEYLLDVALTQFDPSTPDGKRHIVDELAPTFAAIPHAVEKEYYVKLLANKLEVKVSTLLEDLTRVGKPDKTQPKTKLHQPKKTSIQGSQLTELEKYIWFLLLNAENVDVDSYLNQVLSLVFSEPKLNQVVKAIEAAPKPIQLSKLTTTLAEDLQEFIFELTYQPSLVAKLPQLDITQELKHHFPRLQRELLKAKLQSLSAQLAKLDRLKELTTQQQTQHQAILTQISDITKQLAEIE